MEDVNQKGSEKAQQREEKKYHTMNKGMSYTPKHEMKGLPFGEINWTKKKDLLFTMSTKRLVHPSVA